MSGNNELLMKRNEDFLLYDKKQTLIENYERDEQFLFFCRDGQSVVFVQGNTSLNKNRTILKPVNIHSFGMIKNFSLFNQEVLANYNQKDAILEKYKHLGIKSLYIPTNRTLRVYQHQQKIFSEQTNKEYDLVKEKYSPFSGKVIIENGENFAEDIFKLKNSDFESEEKLRKYQNFLSEHFFQNEQVHIRVDATNFERKVVKIKIGIEKEQSIHNLGDGLQMAIILTFPLFNYDKAFLFIEEPEIFMHPGFQNKLIQIYGNHPLAKNFMFFIVSHSNHILDSVTQQQKSSVYSIKKKKEESTISKQSLPKFLLTPLQYGDNQILDLLGVSNTSVFLSNCTIWVEGITDKLYLRKMIQEYLKRENLDSKYNDFNKYQEGISYNFVYSAGDNIIHYDFEEEIDLENLDEKIPIKYLCGKSLVIIDDDNGKNLKRKSELKEKLGMNFYELQAVEIESILAYNTIVDTIMTYSSWKTLNKVSIPKNIPETKYKKIRLGSLIDYHILHNAQRNIEKGTKKLFSISDVNNRNSKKKNDKTLNCKVDFCKRSLPFITSDRLTESSIHVVERILDFVIEQNK